MSTIEDNDRRAAGALRIPFEALVEVGADSGAPFEAQAVDVSRDGMHLRTAYLPEIGQTLSCRFEAGRDGVVATAEVVWRQEGGRGGEFGIRFLDLDNQSSTTLARLVAGQDEPMARPSSGKVRLHIDGLGSPMRARVKGHARGELTVGSELGFLQVGKALELEDADTGVKRAAWIDRVDVQIDPESQVPQLMVALRYEQDAVDSGDAVTPGPSTLAGEPSGGGPVIAVPIMEAAEPLPEPVAEEIPVGMQNMGDRVKGAISRGAAQVGPSLSRWAASVKTTAALLAAKRASGANANGDAATTRRTTAPAPNGGLHATGRKVVRGGVSEDDPFNEAEGRTGSAALMRLNKKKVAIGAMAGAGLLLVLVATRKPAPPPAPSPTAETEAASAAAAATAPATPATVAAPLPPAPPPPVAPSTPLFADGSESANVSDAPERSRGPHRKVHVVPFGSGAVAHGNVLRLKMDGTIEKIQGASQPTGFTVQIPGRRSMEPAAPLAARDGRIDAIKVNNDGAGAELSILFKDGVPNYQVRAKGDVLEIVLASGASPRVTNVSLKDHEPVAKRRHPAHKH